MGLFWSQQGHELSDARHIVSIFISFVVRVFMIKTAALSPSPSPGTPPPFPHSPPQGPLCE